MATTPAQPCRLRILTLVARPLDCQDLPDVADAWTLMDGLRQVQAPVYLGFVRPPTESRLRLRLAEEWDIVHFDGHGNPQALALEREDGTTDPLLPEAFLRLLREGKRPPRLVVLSACASEALGRSLTRFFGGIPYVVAMRRPVDVATTMQFVRVFYTYLAQGLPVGRAFAAARDDLPSYERDIPLLLRKPLTWDRPLCTGGPAGEPQVEAEDLDGLPGIGEHGFFYGEFTKPGEDPPGRKALLQRLSEWLQDPAHRPKLVVLCGEGGIGKTALARTAARRLAWAFGGRVLYVDGAPHQAAGGLRLEKVLAPFGEVLGPKFQQEKAPAKQRAEAIRWLREPGRSALLVVDNADAAEEEAWRFLGDLPEPSAALVTCREERQEGRPLRVPPLRPEEGLGFFCRAVAGKGGPVPLPLEVLQTEEEKKQHRALWGAAREIVSALGCHPQALLLAAALWVKEGPAYPQRQVREHPSRGLEDRFDFAWTGLGAEEQGWLVEAAAFAGGVNGMTLAWAHALAAAPEREEPLTEAEVAEADEALRGLARRAWLSREGEGSFRMHPVVRDYVRRKAGPSLEAADRGFARAFLHLAHAYRSLLGDVTQARGAVAFARAERTNLLRGQEVLLEQGDLAGAVAYAYRLNNLFERTGDWGDRRQALERGLEAARKAGAQRDVAALAHNLGVLAQDQGDYGEARRLYGESLKIEEALGDRAGVAQTLHQLGNLAYLQGDYGEARRLYGEAAQVFADLGAQREQAAVLHQLGNLAYLQGDYGEARRLYGESLKIKEALGDRAGVAQTLHNLGALAQDQGDYGEARRLYGESLKIEEALGDRAGVAITKHALALLEEREGNLRQALALIREAEATFIALRSPYAAQARQVRERIERKVG